MAWILNRSSGKLTPAVQHQHRNPDEQPGHQGERASPALVAVDDLYAVTPDDPDEARDRAYVELGAHGHRVVPQAGVGAALHPTCSRGE